MHARDTEARIGLGQRQKRACGRVWHEDQLVDVMGAEHLEHAVRPGRRAGGRGPPRARPTSLVHARRVPVLGGQAADENLAGGLRFGQQAWLVESDNLGLVHQGSAVDHDQAHVVGRGAVDQV